MFIETISRLLLRDINRLQQEIEAYADESQLWQTPGTISNSAGNLCLHLAGNLQTYIGRELGGTGYVRDRPAEFTAKNIPRSELIALLQHTASVVERTLAALDPAILQEEYPVLIWEEKTTVEYVLVHLATHLTYHLGQVNYHRRLLQ